MNWNPSYSYSTLPAGYHYDSLPAHWKTMLRKVEPAEKGIPQFRNIYVNNIEVRGVRKLVNAAGLKESLLQNFNFKAIKGDAGTAGDIAFASKWTFSNVKLSTRDGKAFKILNSSDVENISPAALISSTQKQKK
jgi:hypothetical protein